MERHMFRVGHHSHENAGVRDGERVYPPAPGRHPNTTHFIVRDVVLREVDSIQMDSKWKQKIKDGMEIRPLNVCKNNAAYEFSYPGLESFVTRRPYQFTGGRFDVHDRGFCVQLRAFVNAKYSALALEASDRAEYKSDAAREQSRRAESMAREALDEVARNRARLQSHDRALAGQKRRMDELEDGLRGAARKFIAEALRTRGLEARVDQFERILEHVVQQSKEGAQPTPPPEPCNCYVCWETLVAGQKVMSICGQKSHAICLECALGMLAVEGHGTGDASHAFGRQHCGMCRGRDDLLQQVIDAGGYAYDPADVAAEIAAAHDRRLQAALPNRAPPLPDEADAVEPPPPLVEPAAPQQAAAVAPQPQPADGPEHMIHMGPAFEAMGFERGLVVYALDAVGTKGYEAVLEYLLQLSAPSSPGPARVD